MARIVGAGPLICRAMDSNEGYIGTVMEGTFHIWRYGLDKSRRKSLIKV